MARVCYLCNLRNLRIVIGFWFLLGLPLAALGQDLAELEEDHALTFEVKTPHIRWARPYAKGTTRVLFFIGGRDTVFRECVELMQRFDLKAEAVLWARIVDSKVDHWHGDEAGVGRMAALLEKDWDVFVFLGISPEKMPGPLRQRMFEKVRGGAGMVLSGVAENEMPRNDEWVGGVPFLAGVSGLEMFSLVKGRGARLPARPDIAYGEGWQNRYESWQEGLGRAMLWAAGKAPEGRLTFDLSAPFFSRQNPGSVRIGWTGKSSVEKGRLELWIRQPAGWTAPWPDGEIGFGETVERSFPGLPAGNYHLDGRVVSASDVETWATIPFQVVSGAMIARLDLLPDWGEIGGKIIGKVTLAGPPNAGENVRVQVLDANRRALLQRDMEPRESVDFSFDIPPWLPMLTTVEASLMKGGEALFTASRYFRTTRRNRNQFNFLMWDVPRGTLAPYAEESLARTGVTLQLGQGNPPLYVAANAIAWVPYTTHIWAKLDAKGVMTPFCWNDVPAVWKKTTDTADQHKPSRRHGVFVYSLGDEIATRGACLADTCLDAYRRYLKETYGSLDALNRSWGTDFASWEAVGLSDPADPDETRSLKAENYPRWFDRQAFKSHNFVQYALQYAGAYQTMDPQAKTGFEGAGRFASGDDVDWMVRNLGFWSPYPGTADEVVRSIAPRDFPRANWMGYTKDADSLLQKYWRMVTRGMDAVWWWRWECIGRFHGWLAPDFRPYPAVKQILDDTRMVRGGLGDLLLQSQMQDDGIAMLYSYPSTFAHGLDEGAHFEGYEKAHLAWHKAIRDTGLQFSYVTDRMLRLGEFDPKRFRVLILSRAEAIGDREAEVIRVFAAQGGTVIADTRPGIYDDHCKKRKTGVLDDLFGVRRQGYAQAKILFGADKKSPIAIDPGVAGAAGGGTAAGDLEGVPVLIEKRVGKGRALLLNGDLGMLGLISEGKAMAGEQENKTVPTPFELAALDRILWKPAGVRPMIALTRDDGSAMRGVEIIRWKNGANEIVALFRQGGNNESATVTLDREAYVYDLRNRKGLGLVRQFKTGILANRASFFAMLPEPASPLKVEVKSPLKRGNVAQISLCAPEAQGTQAFTLVARFPQPAEAPRSGPFFPTTGYPWTQGWLEGERREMMKRVVVVGREPVAVDLPVAFNDPKGEYEISAKELFSQRTVTARLRVE